MPKLKEISPVPSIESRLMKRILATEEVLQWLDGFADYFRKLIGLTADHADEGLEDYDLTLMMDVICEKIGQARDRLDTPADYKMDTRAFDNFKQYLALERQKASVES